MRFCFFLETTHGQTRSREEIVIGFVVFLETTHGQTRSHAKMQDRQGHPGPVAPKIARKVKIARVTLKKKVGS